MWNQHSLDFFFFFEGGAGGILFALPWLDGVGVTLFERR